MKIHQVCQKTNISLQKLWFFTICLYKKGAKSRYLKVKLHKNEHSDPHFLFDIWMQPKKKYNCAQYHEDRN